MPRATLVPYDTPVVDDALLTGVYEPNVQYGTTHQRHCAPK
jgi:hypothetical protein